MSFSAEWLALREPVDHRSRDQALAGLLAGRMQPRPEPQIVDLGCGTGSNLRATAPLLGPKQRWTLVDYDPLLLKAARERLCDWADKFEAREECLILRKANRDISVRFRQADLVADLDGALGEAPVLVTASALFDLCSEPFIERFAAAVAARRAMFYTVLTYDGVQTWTPSHEADDAMRTAFIAHQKTDKGFGVSAGPDAPDALKRAFEMHGYSVREADTPWRLGEADRSLIRDLAQGFSGAVGETGKVSPEMLSAWRAIDRVEAVVGHTDTLALPPA